MVSKASVVNEREFFEDPPKRKRAIVGKEFNLLVVVGSYGPDPEFATRTRCLKSVKLLIKLRHVWLMAVCTNLY